MYRGCFGFSHGSLRLDHRFNARFPRTPHSDVINHDGSVCDREAKLLQVAAERDGERTDKREFSEGFTPLHVHPQTLMRLNEFIVIL